MDRSRPLDHLKRAAARRLRERATRAEVLLWRSLERVPVANTHFRRQVPIGRYVVDFACLAARLVIELDGGHLAEAEQVKADADRTAWLESEGYRVLRFWNREVEENLEGVLDTIHAAIHGSLGDQADASADSTSARRAGSDF